MGTSFNSYQRRQFRVLASVAKRWVFLGGKISRNTIPELVSRLSRRPAAGKSWRRPTGCGEPTIAKHQSEVDLWCAPVLMQLGDAHPLALVTSGDRDRVTRQLREISLTTLSPRAFAAAIRRAKNRIRSRSAWLFAR